MVTVAPEVEGALQGRRAVVALESTIIAHGLPYPDNLAVAEALEDAVRQGGAVPATIAVLGGRIHVGLTPAERQHLAETGTGFGKASAADLAVYIAEQRDAATTVSATALIAARAGIRVFATGGIGGVHRGNAGDISCDLTTLASVPVAVVTAGAKAILDLPRTVEMLETLGVLVIGYQTGEFPAFYTRTSGIRLDHRADSAGALASLLRARFDELGQGGVIIANPIPDQAALDPGRINAAITEALAQAEAAGVAGKALTPFLLAKLAQVTGGASVVANRALAENNARLAAAVASAYAR